MTRIAAEFPRLCVYSPFFTGEFVAKAAKKSNFDENKFLNKIILYTPNLSKIAVFTGEELGDYAFAAGVILSEHSHFNF